VTRDEARREGTPEKTGLAAKALLRTPPLPEGSMHPSGCTALASARAHRVCIFLAWFQPRQPPPPSPLLRCSSTLPFISSLFLSHSLDLAPSSRLLSFSPNLLYSHLHRRCPLPPSYPLLRFLTLLYAASPYSLLTFSARPQAYLYLSRLSLFLARSLPSPSDPSRLVPFRTFRFSEAKPYLRIIPPRRGTSYDLYTCV